MVASILLVIGSLATLVGFVMVIIAAFKEGILWGLASLFIPIVALVFAVMHWDVASKGCLVWVGGTALCIVGFVMSASGAQ